VVEGATAHAKEMPPELIVGFLYLAMAFSVFSERLGFPPIPTLERIGVLRVLPKAQIFLIQPSLSVSLRGSLPVTYLNQPFSGLCLAETPFQRECSWNKAKRLAVGDDVVTPFAL